MTIVELLQTLRSSGVSVSTEHGKLKTVAPKGAIDAGLATLIRNRKDELVAFLERAGEQADAAALRVLKAPAAATYPLSFAQQRLWFIDQLQGHSRQYNMPTALRLSGRLDVAALQRALDALVERHEALRTCFAAVDGTPVQVVQPAAGVAIARHDLSGLDAAAQQSRLQEMASAEAARPFDLSRDLMLRCSLINLGEDEHALLFTLHHIASDGWSLGVLVREIGALYTAFCQGQANPLAPLDVQYTDYASWQRGLLQGDVLQRQLGFWREHLDGAPGLLELPTDRARPPVQSYAGNYVPVRLSADISNGLRRLSQRHGTTLFMTLLAGWSLLLSRLSGQDDVVVGTPVANRQRAEIEPLIGFFANTLAMRVQLQDNPSVAGLLAQVRQTALQAYAYQDLPFEQVVEALQPARSLSHSPVFQVMLAMNNTPGGGDSGLPGLRLAPLRVPHASTHFDLVLSLNEAEEEIRGGLEYASDIFDHATLERWVGHLAVLLQAMAADEQCAVQDLPLLDAAARARVVDEFNATATDYARDSLVHELVEAQVPRSPQAVAVVYDDQSLTYAELNERANRLAHYLRGQGAGPDARVVICMERSLEMAVAVLGTLKAGAAYVPLDPAYPAERRAYMLQDSAPMLVLTQTALLGEFGDSPLPLLALDVETFAAQPASDPPRVQGSDAANLAYVIYTSGSTGRPKGVCLPHRALVNLMQWHLQELAPTARCLQFASLSFDASFHELFAAWLCGGAVIVPPEEVRRDSVALAQFLQQQRIDKAILPVVMLQHLAEQHCEAPQPLAALREVMATGEQLKLTPAIRRLFEQLPQARLHNHYGPSETHVVTAEILAGAPADWPTFPSIGRPIANSQIYVLDRQRRPVPIGVFGEVFIGGDNLARSYLNRPELTQERFVSETLGGAAPQRLYKTGDVGRWGNDGHIEYVGRNDHQVKIRGFRVEPGEIETALTAHAQVREAVVVARDDSFGGKRLVAYLTHPDGVTADVEALREYLRGALPEYMVPAQFVSLDALPLSANRKIDRSALPEPEASAALQVAPQTATELCLAQIWQRILKQESIGRHANFFELGGHSLLATRVVSEIAKAFGKPLAVRALFEHPSLAGLAAHIDSQRHTGYAAIAPRPRDGALPLSFAQQRLWILDKVDKAASALYRIPAALRLSGQLDRAALQATLDRIVARHESLRTGFVEIDGMARQQIAPATAGFVLLDHDLRDLDAAAQADAVAQLSASESQADFDLARGPLVRGRLLQLADSEHVLLVTQHHIVSDGWSIGVLVKEVSALYTAFCQGQPDPLPPLAIQYADFAAWQRERLHGALLQGHLDYWRSQLAGLPAVHNLPLDKPRPAQQRFAGGRAQLDLDAATLAGLHALARRHDASLFMLLQAAFALLVARWSGETDIVMGTPIAGRLHPDVEPLIGFFVNTLVLRSDLSANPTFEQLLAQARATALAAYEHQEIPFEMLVDELKPVRSLSHAPLFQLLFSMQNNEQAVLDLPGLSLAPAASRSEQSKFDLQLSALETGHGLRLSWTYAQSLFEPASIARLSAAFGRLLQAVVATPQLPVMQLPLLDATDRARLAQWNETAADFDDACFHHLFEQQARRTPDAIAIRHGDESLSYAQLNRRANQLAQQLRQRGVGPDTTVALCLERSLQLGPAILGVMKAGGAYLPLDAASPDEHLGYILQDSGAVLAISHGTLAQRLARLGASVLALDAADSGSGLDEAPLVPGLSTANLAYSIYTSGSSGRPKGVLVEHRSLANLAANLSAGGIADGLIRGCWALAASTAFDGSIKALVQWASGGEVLVVPESTKLDAQALRALLREYRVDIMDCTPSLLESWLAAGLGDCLPNLVIGGEAINPDLWARLVEWQAASGRQAINVYGPSECCVDTTWARVSGSQPVIGRNLANVVCHVVSESGEIVPVGVPGELYVGGAGVARGYRNQPELTAARFVADPFGGSGRLYRSGDRVRRREDGALEFLGRLDDQVKLRGFRIELGEPEAVLRRCDGVREALVLVRGTGSEARLVAYVVADAQPALVDALKAQLAAQLPVYMHPAAYVVLERLPLTVNGKVDKAALPLPELQAAQAYVAPGGETEARLAAIWQQVLRRERVGIHDNFFEIGGDSILAIQVTSRANQAGIGITTRQLFEAQTIAALAQCV
ncbi:amino acid adenylation domain-containing protein, partial [Tahibacter aquaticus]